MSYSLGLQAGLGLQVGEAAAGAAVARGPQIDLLALPNDPTRRTLSSVPEADALVDHGVLQEAALVAFRVDGVQAWAALLFDCRGALQIELANPATGRDRPAGAELDH